jgi:hypothetical protein
MATDSDGFDRFFEFYFPRVYALAWMRHRDESQAQDTTQHVLTALLLHAVPPALARTPEDRELQKLALSLVDEYEPARRLRTRGWPRASEVANALVGVVRVYLVKGRAGRPASAAARSGRRRS